MATSTKKCPICKDELQNPRLLPCIHSFCLECLEQHCKDKLPGDEVLCPECRTEFEIPKNGVADLPVRTHDEEQASSATCEACSIDQRCIPATVYCKDCSQKLCENCGISHREITGGFHDVIPLESATHERGRGRYCEKHEDERIKIYCSDCNITICPMCCLETHNNHNYERTEKVAGKFSRSIDDDIKQVTSRIDCFRGAITQLEAENNNRLDNIKAIELEVKKRSKEIKQLVDL